MRLLRGETHVHVELTRRNLLVLLAKLDGHPPNSARTITKTDWDGTMVAVTAVENDAHYADTAPGPMHEATEAVL